LASSGTQRRTDAGGCAPTSGANASSKTNATNQEGEHRKNMDLSSLLSPEGTS
jgi:hypothetical protein